MLTYKLNNKIVVEQFINSSFSSNTFILRKEKKQKAVIIDPGSDIQNAISFLEENSLDISCIVLTHEHFDHICGLYRLLNYKKVPVIASRNCHNNIMDETKTLGKYIEKDFSHMGVELSLQFNISNDFFSFNYDEFDFDFYLTPGHSEGSMCFKCANAFFSGDTYLRQIKAYTHFPGADDLLLKKSLETITPLITSNMLIFPGHGNPFSKIE